MVLKKNEYTTPMLIDFLTQEYKCKLSKEPFTQSDIAQYCLRGYLPHRYGGNKLTVEKTSGIKVITVHPKK
jgi:hypothetical protein